MELSKLMRLTLRGRRALLTLEYLSFFLFHWLILSFLYFDAAAFLGAAFFCLGDAFGFFAGDALFAAAAVLAFFGEAAALAFFTPPAAFFGATFFWGDEAPRLAAPPFVAVAFFAVAFVAAGAGAEVVAAGVGEPGAGTAAAAAAFFVLAAPAAFVFFGEEAFFDGEATFSSFLAAPAAAGFFAFFTLPVDVRLAGLFLTAAPPLVFFFAALVCSPRRNEPDAPVPLTCLRAPLETPRFKAWRRWALIEMMLSPTL
jgi:hypothetical protein